MSLKPATYSLGEDAQLVIPERGPWLVRVYGERQPSEAEVRLLRAEVARRYRRTVTLGRWTREGNCWTAEVKNKVTTAGRWV